MDAFEINFSCPHGERGERWKWGQGAIVGGSKWGNTKVELCQERRRENRGPLGHNNGWHEWQTARWEREGNLSQELGKRHGLFRLGRLHHGCKQGCSWSLTARVHPPPQPWALPIQPALPRSPDPSQSQPLIKPQPIPASLTPPPYPLMFPGMPERRMGMAVGQDPDLLSQVSTLGGTRGAARLLLARVEPPRWSNALIPFQHICMHIAELAVMRLPAHTACSGLCTTCFAAAPRAPVTKAALGMRRKLLHCPRPHTHTSLSLALFPFLHATPPSCSRVPSLYPFPPLPPRFAPG